MVAYRQTLAKPVEIETRYIKQTGGRGKFAVINMKYEPLTKEQVEEWAAEMEEEGEKPDPNNIYFVDEIVGGVVPKEYIPSVEHGFRDAAREGGQVRLPVRGHASATLLRRQVPRRRLVAGRVQAGGDGELPRRPGQGRHHAAGADHERGGDRARSSTRAI